MAEDELKADMEVKLAASTKAPVDEMTAAALVDATTEPSPTESAAELDEDSAKRAQDNMVRHVMEKEAEDKQAHEEHMAEIQEYIQEELVDNFRPVQPLNGRLIERSFKLSVQQVFVATNGGPNPPSYNIPENNSHRGHSAESKSDGSGAGLAGLSFITVLASVLALLMC